MPDDHVTTAELARRAGVHVRTIARAVANGELTPATQAPGKRGAYLFTEDEADRFIGARQFTTRAVRSAG